MYRSKRNRASLKSSRTVDEVEDVSDSDITTTGTSDSSGAETALPNVTLNVTSSTRPSTATTKPTNVSNSGQKRLRPDEGSALSYSQSHTKEILQLQAPSQEDHPLASFVGAIAPCTNNNETAPKAKRIHLDHAKSRARNWSLARPFQVVKSRDPSPNLYPRESVKFPLGDRSASGHFVKASEMVLALPASLQAKLSASSEAEQGTSSEKPMQKTAYLQGDHKSVWKPTSQSNFKKKTKTIGNQSNTISNYFSKEEISQRHSSSAIGFDKESDDDVIVLDGPDRPVTRAVEQDLCTSVPENSTQPDLPSLLVHPSRRTQFERSVRKGDRYKVLKQGNMQIGPSSHNLRKATFLYNSELAKPDAAPKKTKAVDTYGLLGSGNFPSGSQESGYFSYFDGLPYELIENIFCRLPMLDLFLNVNRVCLAWKDVISDPTFLPWKKRYHKVKAEQCEETDVMRALLAENKMTSLESFLPQLIRYMRNYKKVTSSGMDSCLEKHSKYNDVRALLEERFGDCLDTSKVPNAWCTITALVLVSEYVSDIQEIGQVLLSSMSQCTAYDVIECLYCIATFLLVFTNSYTNAPWNGMHYRLYYALYLLENESTTTSDQLQDAASHGRGGQQSLIKYSTGSTVVQMTHEQLRICNQNVTDGDLVKIVAFAGTGKTTTLVKYTRLRPNLKFLLVVYNKSVQTHSMTKFPSNVTCKTGHALAFRFVGRKYAAKNKISRSNLKVSSILDHFTAIKGESLYVQAKFIIDTLERFMASADSFITTAHVPEYKVDDNNIRKHISQEHRMHYSNEATKVWEKMIDLNNNKVLITHDTYLKLYQLQRPSITGYDVILIDEAQDMTPALADILLSQKKAKVLVGDPHQQIYAFRGAVNAMQQVTATHTFYLTQSFRFGSEIAFVAASCLSILKSERKKTLVGNASTGSVRGGVEGQLAIITRSNFTLFNEAVKKCCYSDSPQRVAFIGGTESFGFDTIIDIYSLMSTADGQRNINNKFIARFSTLGELEKYAIKTSDIELLGKIKIVKTYHHSLPSLISKIRSKCINDTDIADIVLSTAHKAKGLEFSTVRLTDDFGVDMSPIVGAEGVPRIGGDECNLLYVATTRAKKRLILTNTLKMLLQRAGEHFDYPVLTKQLSSKGRTFECDATGTVFEPCALTLVHRGVSMGEECDQDDVLYSPQTVHREMAPIRQLYGCPGKEEDEQAENEIQIILDLDL